MAHYALDSDNESVIHQDSDDDDDDVEHDDDVDIGFRRHQYQTFDDDSKRRRRTKEDSIYGVFLEDDERIRKRSKAAAEPSSSTIAPMFVAAKKTEEPPKVVPKTKKEAKTEEEDKKEEKEEEESPEDKEIKEKQKVADDYFLNLLNKGRGKQRRQTPPPATSKAAPKQWGEESFESMAPGLGMPTSFGKMEEKPPEPFKIDPNLAKWERHTKGIGSKLLAKMGWKGKGGLGSNRRQLKKAVGEENEGTGTVEKPEKEEGKKDKKGVGISKPVEVVVRPANLGLGFGNFKEASQLKANRQIEAEVSGIEFPDAKKKKEKSEGVTWGPATASSSIPTTKELLSQKQWKRHRKASQKAAKPQLIPYTELLEKQKAVADGQPVIIDMRGPSADKTTTTEDGKVLLAEELLHNVSFLLNTHENKLHSSSHFVKSSERKCNSLKSDIQEMKKRQKEGQERLAKLNKTLSIVDKVEALTQQRQDVGNGKHPQEEVRRLILQLGETFTTEERHSLKFWEILAPTLLSPIIQLQLNQWDPLGDLSSGKSVIDSVFEMDLGSASTNQDKDAIRSLRQSIVLNQLLPKIKQELESSRWNPSRDTEEALDLYEYLHQKASDAATQNDHGRHDEEDNGQVFPGSIDHENKQENLAEAIKKDLILDTIYPKIQSTLSHWKPALKGGNGKSLQLEERLDLWIIPWVPHMDHPAILPNLLSDCKRKLKSTISFLQRKSGNDMEFLRACVDTLRPWQRVFDTNAMQRLVSEYVTPNLARCLAKEKIRRDVTEQDWWGLRIAFELHGRGFLSSIEFISVIEGELLTNWAITIHGLLLNGSTVSNVAANYRGWKLQVLVRPYLGENASVSLDRSLRLLQQDRQICSIFYSVLRMIQIANSSERDQLDEMHIPRTNFRVVSTRRAKEKQREVQEDFVRMESKSASEIEARIRLQRRNVQTPTFRDVVEEYAKERGILFQPRMGVNSLKDGKQVFLFGKAPIFMVGDVIYIFKDSDWQPISLDQLTKSAENSV